MKIFLKDGECYSSFPASLDMDVEIRFARSATSYRLFGFRLRFEENFYHRNYLSFLNNQATENNKTKEHFLINGSGGGGD